MRCPECGRSQARSDTRFCGGCGSKLPTREGGWGAGRWAATGVATAVVLAAIVALPLVHGGATDDGPLPAAVEAPAEEVRLGVTGGWSTAVAEPSRPELWGLARAGPDLYAVGDGALYRVDAADGTVRWRHGGPAWFHAGPALAGGVVTVSGSGRIVGVDADDGARIWALRTPEHHWEHLTASEEAVVATGHHGTPDGLVATVAALDPMTGTVRWWTTFPDEWTTPAPPLHIGDIIVAGTYGRTSGSVHAFDLGSGQTLWTAPISGLSWLTTRDGVVYAASGREVAAFEVEGGEERWRTEVSFQMQGSGSVPRAAIIADELVVVAEEPEPVAVGLAPTDGTILWVRELVSLADGEHRGSATADARPGRLIDRPTIVLADDVGGVLAVTVAGGEPDGRVRAVDLEDTEVWEQQADGPFAGRPWVSGPPGPADGNVYLRTDEGELTALAISDGSVLWRSRIPAWGWVSDPLATDGLIISDQDTELVALSGADGRRAWTVERTGRPGLTTIGAAGTIFVGGQRRLRELEAGRGAVIAGDPLDPPSDVHALAADDERVYAGSGYGVHAFDAGHRRQRWDHAVQGAVGMLATGAGSVVSVTEDLLEVLDAEDGTRRWSASVAACVPPVVTADAVVIGTERGLVGFDLEHGEVRWRLVTARPVCAPLAAAGGLVHATDLVRTVIAVDATTGELVWRHRIEGGVAAPPGAGAGLLAVATLGGEVRLLDVVDGTERGSVDLVAAAIATPLITGDAIVILDQEGRLHAHPIGDLRGTVSPSR